MTFCSHSHEDAPELIVYRRTSSNGWPYGRVAHGLPVHCLLEGTSPTARCSVPQSQCSTPLPTPVKAHNQVSAHVPHWQEHNCSCTFGTLTRPKTVSTSPGLAQAYGHHQLHALPDFWPSRTHVCSTCARERAWRAKKSQRRL